MDDEATTRLLVEGAVAIGLGVMIGLEREHHEVTRRASAADTTEGEAPAAAETLLGVRTFALLCLLGWASAVLAASQLVGLAVAAAITL